MSASKPFVEGLSPDDRAAAAALISLALAEDLGERGDLTSQTLIPPEARGTVQVVARQTGILAGVPLVAAVFARLDSDVTVTPRRADGDRLTPGAVVADVSGSVRSLLTGERTMLNFLTHL